MIHSERECRDMIEEIIQRGTELSDWETNFVDDMFNQEFNYTVKQAEIIDRIWEHRVR